MQCTAHRDCAFCADPAHFMGSCPLVDRYIQAGKASRGTNGRLYLPDGRHIPCVQGTRCLCKCLDHLPAPMAATQANSVVTPGIFSVSSSSSDAVLDIEPLVFMTPVDQDGDNESNPALADPEFQAYLANTWSTFQADKRIQGSKFASTAFSCHCARPVTQIPVQPPLQKK